MSSKDKGEPARACAALSAGGVVDAIEPASWVCGRGTALPRRWSMDVDGVPAGEWGAVGKTRARLVGASAEDRMPVGAADAVVLWASAIACPGGTASCFAGSTGARMSVGSKRGASSF
ncbi:hypothetical protein [Sphingomonas oligoaromativorans]|uniref:hypothetical protein n=1 Tax=Sphingomonas oligoaromativorans TaxID=575322 RepID=UPI001422A5D0|nr:hypothetical protein [Sphingomonas oligoaromativorans]NIJ35046.1 hypothetical protein [Sphingomonas oligoaromativorans]